MAEATDKGVDMWTGRLAIVLVLTGSVVACGGKDSPTAPTAVTPPPVPPTLPTPSAPAPPVALPGPPSSALSAMLADLPAYINTALAENRDNLPRNPQSASQIQQKITLLQNPALAQEIRDGRRWAESTTRGRTIALIFPAESMRAEAPAAIQTIEDALGRLEEFLGRPFPTSTVRVWYGFKLGNTGGGGSIFAEDRGTYEQRTPPTRAPFDAILAHELGHSWIGNESLTQFLEMYAYNVARTGSTTPTTWSWTRSWVPNAASNQDSAALLDVYQLVGHDTMTRGYRTLLNAPPPYGVPLTESAIQAFLGQVATTQQSQVGDKLRRITF